MEKSKCSFCKIFKEKYKEFCLNEKEEEEKKEEEKRTLEMLQKYKSEEDEFEKIPFEIGTAIKTGDIKLFINYINNNISYIPEYLLLLSNPKFNGSIYSINLINFTYYLLSNKKYINKLNSCVELITNQFNTDIKPLNILFNKGLYKGIAFAAILVWLIYYVFWNKINEFLMKNLEINKERKYN